MKERQKLCDPSSDVSLRRQCDLLALNRSSLYFRPLGESAENLALMEEMDKLFLDDPTLGVIGMQDALRDIDLHYNVKRIRRLMRKMGLEAIYPKRNLSRLGKAKYIHPYLLRDCKIERPNQVWAIDISYIPMKSGFMYLSVIIDWYSRYVVDWQVSNSMEKETQTELLHAAIAQYGKPEILNSDQGSQYTSEHWVSTLKDLGIQISMDGKGRATDNAIVERFFRTIKQRYIYLNPAKSGLELHQGIDTFMYKYKRKRHQGIGRVKPIDRYQNAA